LFWFVLNLKLVTLVYNVTGYEIDDLFSPPFTDVEFFSTPLPGGLWSLPSSLSSVARYSGVKRLESEADF